MSILHIILENYERMIIISNKSYQDSVLMLILLIIVKIVLVTIEILRSLIIIIISLLFGSFTNFLRISIPLMLLFHLVTKGNPV